MATLAAGGPAQSARYDPALWAPPAFMPVLAPVLAPLVLSGAGFAAFLVWEAKCAVLTIIPMRVLRNRTVAGICISNCMK